jgi:hypothetical protein
MHCNHIDFRSKVGVFARLASKSKANVTDTACRQIERANQIVGNEQKGKVVIMFATTTFSCTSTAAARDTKKQWVRLSQLTGGTSGQCF